MFEIIENKEITIIDLPVQLCGYLIRINYYKVRFKFFELLFDSNQFRILFLKYF